LLVADGRVRIAGDHRGRERIIRRAGGKRVGESPSRVGDRLSRVGQPFPNSGEALPHWGIVFPELGSLSPTRERPSPSGGSVFPSWAGSPQLGRGFPPFVPASYPEEIRTAAIPPG